jgi:hypothetical protein
MPHGNCRRQPLGIRTALMYRSGLITFSMTFYAAHEYCRSIKMKLLAVDSEEKLDLIYERSENVFPTGGATTIWINGG